MVYLTPKDIMKRHKIKQKFLSMSLPKKKKAELIIAAALQTICNDAIERLAKN